MAIWTQTETDISLSCTELKSALLKTYLADRGGVSLPGPASNSARCRFFFLVWFWGVHNDIVYVVNTVLVYVDINVYGWVYVNCIKTV